MANLPQHKAVQLSDCGIFLKEVSPTLKKEAVDYAHQDDYYMFGLVYEGTCSVDIDFKEYRLGRGDVLCVQPGQVHSFVRATDLRASVLLIDGLFISDMDKHAIAEYALDTAPLSMGARQQSELDRLFSILSDRAGNMDGDVPKEIVRCLACSVVAIIVEAMQNADRPQPKGRRHIELILKFRELVRNGLHGNRSPSHYAALLNISPGYLNEVVNAVAGMSAGRYIQHEVVLAAKRRLYYTNETVQEIACGLGFDDYAYFSRLFVRTAGISPTVFRKKYLG